VAGNGVRADDQLVADRRVDIAMAGMSDLPRGASRRLRRLHEDRPQFFTTHANAGEIKTIEDLCGKKVGASRSTNWPTQMEEL
jgi:polar amino acid transport system substrate-binding protein